MTRHIGEAWRQQPFFSLIYQKVILNKTMSWRLITPPPSAPPFSRRENRTWTQHFLSDKQPPSSSSPSPKWSTIPPTKSRQIYSEQPSSPGRWASSTRLLSDFVQIALADPAYYTDYQLEVIKSLEYYTAFRSSFTHARWWTHGYFTKCNLKSSFFLL